MSRFRLTYWQRRRLLGQLKTTAEARTYRRTLAVLELDRGRSAAEVAEMLGVTRQSVYNWAAAFAREHGPSSLEDDPRSGRPRLLTEPTEWSLRSLMPQSPQELGYPDTDWTTPLLQQELERGTGSPPSDDTVRRVLHRLGYVWKRPRYVLDPDPERGKKTPHPAADPRPAAAQRGAGRGRGRPVAVPAAAGRLVAAGRTGGGPHQRPGRPAGGLRGDEPLDRGAAVAAPAPGAGRQLPGVPQGSPPSRPGLARRDVAGRGPEPHRHGVAPGSRGNDADVAAQAGAGTEPDGHAVGP